MQDAGCRGGGRERIRDPLGLGGGEGAGRQRELSPRSQVVSQLLMLMGSPERLSPTESEEEREERLLKLTCDVKFLSWTDGSPIVNRSWVAHYLMIHYDSLRFTLSGAAQRACRCLFFLHSTTTI